MKPYQGPYPNPEISLYGRAMYGVFELLGQIYLEHPPLTLFGKEQRWDGIVDYYKIVNVISKKNPGIQLPFIVRQIGNC